MFFCFGRWLLPRAFFSFIFLSSISFVIILYFYSALSFIPSAFRFVKNHIRANVFRLGSNSSFSYIFYRFLNSSPNENAKGENERKYIYIYICETTKLCAFSSIRRFQSRHGCVLKRPFFLSFFFLFLAFPPSASSSSLFLFFSAFFLFTLPFWLHLATNMAAAHEERKPVPRESRWWR